MVWIQINTFFPPGFLKKWFPDSNTALKLLYKLPKVASEQTG
jgi:hypothetical protein